MELKKLLAKLYQNSWHPSIRKWSEETLNKSRTTKDRKR